MYVPRGKITTSDAVKRLFELKHSDEAAEMRSLNEEERLLLIQANKIPSCAPPPIAPLGTSRPPVSDDDRKRRDTNLALRADFSLRLKIVRLALKKFCPAIDLAAFNLRDALGEGDLTAIALQDDGNHFEVPVSFWRSETGLRSVMDGFGKVRLPGTSSEVKGNFFLEEKDFVTWAQSAVDAAANLEVGAAKDYNAEPVAAQSGVKISHPTKRAETDCEAWLVTLISQRPNQPTPKNKLWGEADQRFNAAEKRLSMRAFVRARERAIDKTGCHEWAKGGRKPPANKNRSG